MPPLAPSCPPSGDGAQGDDSDDVPGNMLSSHDVMPQRREQSPRKRQSFINDFSGAKMMVKQVFSLKNSKTE
jgi:hypothetical protein